MEASTVTDQLLENARNYAADFDKGPALPPSQGGNRACMDARLNPYGLLACTRDAHVIRNAGGVITDDEIRSLTISSGCSDRGDRSIHTPTAACSRSRRRVQGLDPATQGSAGVGREAFSDLEEDVRQSLARIHASPSSPQERTASSITWRTAAAGGQLRSHLDATVLARPAWHG